MLGHGSQAHEIYRVLTEGGVSDRVFFGGRVGYNDLPGYYCAADLLSSNPEDAVEFKRSQKFEGKFEKEIKTYIDERKKPMSGRNLRARAVVWSKLENMSYFSEMP